MKSKNVYALVFLKLLIVSNLSLAQNVDINTNEAVAFEKFEYDPINDEFNEGEEIDVFFQRYSNVGSVCSNVNIPVDYVAVGLYLNPNCPNYYAAKGFNAINIAKVEGQNNLNVCIASNKPTPVGYVTSNILYTQTCMHSNSFNNNTYVLTKIANQSNLISCFGNYMGPYNSYNPPVGYFYAGSTNSPNCAIGSDNNAYVFNKR